VDWRLLCHRRGIKVGSLVAYHQRERIICVPLAFLSFFVTLVFGFLLGSPGFPKWGMLLFSVAALLLYWVYLGITILLMRLPSEHH
jgi:hypothetical protein